MTGSAKRRSCARFAALALDAGQARRVGLVARQLGMLRLPVRARGRPDGAASGRRRRSPRHRPAAPPTSMGPVARRSPLRRILRCPLSVLRWWRPRRRSRRRRGPRRADRSSASGPPAGRHRARAPAPGRTTGTRRSAWPTGRRRCRRGGRGRRVPTGWGGACRGRSRRVRRRGGRRSRAARYRSRGCAERPPSRRMACRRVPPRGSSARSRPSRAPRPARRRTAPRRPPRLAAALPRR